VKKESGMEKEEEAMEDREEEEDGWEAKG